jgi:hypothetical protein
MTHISKTCINFKKVFNELTDLPFTSSTTYLWFGSKVKYVTNLLTFVYINIYHQVNKLIDFHTMYHIISSKLPSDRL